MHKRFVPLAGLAFGFALGQGCYDGVTPMDTEAGTESSGLQLCQAGLVTCPDGSCHAPTPGACCGFGGLCPSGEDTTTAPDPTNVTSPTQPPLDDSTTTNETVSVTDTSSSSGDDTSSSSSSSSGGSSSSGTTGDDTTSTGEPMPGCYDPLTYPWSGPLCGPAALPCVVQAAETIDALASERSGTPSVAVDDACAPAVLFEQSIGGPFGFSAQRTGDDTWAVLPTPFPITQAGLDFDPDTGLYAAMIHEQGFQLSARTWDGASWSAGDLLPAIYRLEDKAFAPTGYADGLHGLLSQPGVGFLEATWNGAWMVAPMASGGPLDVSPALAVAPDLSHHFTYWHDDVGGPVLRYESPSTGILEPVITYGAAMVEPELVQEIALTDDGAGVVPHVLAGRSTGVAGRVEVVYAQRIGAALWATFVVAAEDPTGETTCDLPPVMAGDTCTLDRITHRPLAIASSLGGDVRWLYTDVHELVDYTAVCAPDCVWVPMVDMSTYDVRIGWLEAGVPVSALLLADRRLVRANAEIDGEGTLHVVGYAAEIPDAAGEGLTVEYFRVGS